ncbi:MAG: FAD-binding oxidoreductase [Acidimicrobiales bacterium]|nr:FAD-binding oxidoreductase [Acidimicrobiales bacterium]
MVARAVGIVGRTHVLTDPDLTASRSVDWTGRFRARPAPVVRPGRVAEVAALVAAARELGVALVPQGGNTGLVGGAVPLDGGVVVDLTRFDGVDDIDATSGQLTAGAGATIGAVQAAAAAAGWQYGVDWSARDTATVGGSVATDAGGLRFIRHGGTRRQLLGVEAVLGTSEVISHLPAVEKDNTGYDLGALLCGSEGTLGLVTRARLRLVPPRAPASCVLVAFGSIGSAVSAATTLRREVVELEAVELMVDAGLALVCSSMGLMVPFATPAPATLLVEVASRADPHALLDGVLTSMDGVVEVVVATDERQRRELWRYRELHTEAIARVGPAHKLDVTLPPRSLADFVTEVPELVASVAPEARTWCFGHAGDGNVHVNVTGIEPGDDSVDEAVLVDVADRGGSISAEHGIGRAKRRWLHLARGPADVSAMVAVKRALDPDGICNPGVLLPSGS